METIERIRNEILTQLSFALRKEDRLCRDYVLRCFSQTERNQIEHDIRESRAEARGMCRVLAMLTDEQPTMLFMDLMDEAYKLHQEEKK